MLYQNLLLPLLAAGVVAVPAPSASSVSRSNPDFLSSSAPLKLAPIIDDEDFNFILSLGIDFMRGGGGGLNDLLSAAAYITPGDFNSFSNTLWALANQTLAEVKKLEAESSGKSMRITTRDSYLSAASYFQFADFYLHGNPSDPRLKQLWAAQKSAFSEGLARLTSVTPTSFNLKTKYNFTIPGFYYQIDDKPRPVIVITTGYDGPQEGFLSWLGPLIIDHGWNFVTYEGPGQPSVIHEQGIGFRPDWEVVLSPVIDWLEKQHTADLTHLTQIGMSLGGYLAARASAFEPRVKAQILNGGIYNVYETFSAPFKPLFQKAGNNHTLFDELVYKYVINNPNASSSDRWAIDQGLYTFDTRSPWNWLQQAKAYTAASWVDRIKIPTWLVNATHDTFFPGQGLEMLAALKKNHAPVTFQTMGGVTSLHDQVGASLELNRRMWAWINKIFPNCPSF